MQLLKKSLKLINALLVKMSWATIIVALITHFFSSWWFLHLAGEDAVAAPDIFWYFYLVTATTVGYGDFSPTTTHGRLIVTLWVMTGGISLFAAIIGKVTQFFIELWRKRMKGLGDYSELSDHIVILGWQEHRTRYMVDQILGDKRRIAREIVLCSKVDMENPMPDKLHFVRGDSLTSNELLQRTGITKASRIIIFAANDDQTLATGLAVSALKPQEAHIVAHFHSEEMARLFQAHCPKAECTSSVSLELIVRSAQDPGSSRVQTQLLSTLTGPTQYAMQIPESFSGCTYGQLFYNLKEKYDATLFGVAETPLGGNLQLNQANNKTVKGGQTIYFMAPERIRAEEIDWNTLTA